MPLMKIAIPIIVLVVAFIVLALTSGVWVKREMGWVDAVTRSTKRQTVWRFGVSSPPVIEQSPLAEWLRRHEGGITYDWRLIKGSYVNVWGRSIGSGHGSAPAIYPLRDEVLQRFVEMSSDNELKAFIHTQRHADEQSQEAAVATAFDRALESLRSDQ